MFLLCHYSIMTCMIHALVLFCDVPKLFQKIITICNANYGILFFLGDDLCNIATLGLQNPMQRHDLKSPVNDLRELMKVLQTHVLGCAYVILCNRSIRLRNTQTLKQWENTVSKHIKHNKLNKEFTQSFWDTSPGPTFSGGLSIVS